MNDAQMVMFSEQVVEAIESLVSLKWLGCCMFSLLPDPVVNLSDPSSYEFHPLSS